MRKRVVVIIAVCALILLSGCGDKNPATYIYEINGAEQGRPVVTLTWDNVDELKIITILLNEAYSSEISEPDARMEYTIELVNSDQINDFFEIGFADGMVCCSGTVQGVTFDHVVSVTVTESDIRNMIYG